MRGETLDMMKRCIEYDAAPLVVIDNLLPVHYGARSTTSLVCNTYSGIGIDEALERDHDWDLKRSRELCGPFGIDVDIGAIPDNTGRALQTKKYYHRNARDIKDRLRHMHDLFRTALESMRRGRPSESYARGLKLDGDILSYPGCCSDDFSSNYFDDTVRLAELDLLGLGRNIPVENPPEILAVKRGAEKLIELVGEMSVTYDNAASLARGIDIKRLFSLFTRSFYPCSVDCEEASGTGMSIYERFNEDDVRLGKIYKEVVLPYCLYTLGFYSRWRRESSQPNEQVAGESIYERMRGFDDHPELATAIEKLYASVKNMANIRKISEHMEMLTRMGITAQCGIGAPPQAPGISIIMVPASGVTTYVRSNATADSHYTGSRRSRKRGVLFPRGRKRKGKK